MSGITLVLTICSVIIAGAHFALVNGEADRNRPVNSDTPTGQWGKCYSCKACDNERNNTEIVACPFYLGSLPGCVSFSINLRGHHELTDPLVFRDCINTLGNCDDIRKKLEMNKFVDLVSCTECFKTECNMV